MCSTLNNKDKPFQAEKMFLHYKVFLDPITWLSDPNFLLPLHSLLDNIQHIL